MLEKLFPLFMCVGGDSCKKINKSIIYYVLPYIMIVKHLPVKFKGSKQNCSAYLSVSCRDSLL